MGACIAKYLLEIKIIGLIIFSYQYGSSVKVGILDLGFSLCGDFCMYPVYGQCYRKHRTNTGFRFNKYFSAQQINKFRRYGKSQTSSSV